MIKIFVQNFDLKPAAIFVVAKRVNGQLLEFFSKFTSSMNPLASITDNRLVTLTDLHPRDRQLVYEVKITVSRDPTAIQGMKMLISEFIRKLMEGADLHSAAVIGRWRITTDSAPRRDLSHSQLRN